MILVGPKHYQAYRSYATGVVLGNKVPDASFQPFGKENPVLDM